MYDDYYYYEEQRKAQTKSDALVYLMAFRMSVGWGRMLVGRSWKRPKRKTSWPKSLSKSAGGRASLTKKPHTTGQLT